MRTSCKRSTSPIMHSARADQWALVLRPLLVALAFQVTILSTHTANAHSTISIAGTSTGKKSTTISDINLASTDGLVALMDVNYLESVNSAASQPSDAYAYDVQPIDEISDNSLASFRAGVAKSRKQAENQMKALDWWARFANKSTKPRAIDAKGSTKSRQATTPPNVYREQPLSQNSILTIRNQLVAIRDKHRLLVTKSVGQLIQLDQKLVDSYKLCLKKKMPLYAGMLYRTRDFVVRMANEVKHERQVLAAMAKQAQRVLRQKVENRTLVKEYNRLASTTDLSTLEPEVSSDQPPTYSQDASAALNGVQGKRSADVASAFATSLTRAVTSSAVAGIALAPTTPQRAVKRDNPRSISDETSAQQPSFPTTDDQKTPAGFLKSSSGSDKIAGYSAATMVARNQQRVGTKKSLSTSNNLLLARRHAPVENNQVISNDASSNSEQVGRLDSEFANTLDDYQPKASSSGSIAAIMTPTDTSSSTRKKLKQQTYTVNINEVNLKRELLKTQALIDRINTSSVELTGVVDDIIYLFKLTSSDYNSKKGLAMSGKTSKYEKMHGGSSLMDIVNSGVDPKRAKKIAKSPLKFLLERYNRLTSQVPANLISAGTGTTPVVGVASARPTSHSDMNSLGDNSVEVDTNNLPELRPLFDSRSLNVEMDLNDLDLGFDAPAVIETQ